MGYLPRRHETNTITNSITNIATQSQGALCAHKSLDASKGLASEHARSQVIALTTFGDPISVWADTITFPALPQNAQHLSYCETSTPDPLCTNPLGNFPHSPSAFLEKLQALWKDFSQTGPNSAQKTALGDLVVQLTSQAKTKIGKLGEDILAGHIRRWMLTPQHFLYGLGPHPLTAQAADDIVRVLQQSK